MSLNCCVHITLHNSDILQRSEIRHYNQKQKSNHKVEAIYCGRMINLIICYLNRTHNYGSNNSYKFHDVIFKLALNHIRHHGKHEQKHGKDYSQKSNRKKLAQICIIEELKKDCCQSAKLLQNNKHHISKTIPALLKAIKEQCCCKWQHY